MFDYEVRYIDKIGDYQDYQVSSIDARSAMKMVFEMCPDARRIITCKRKAFSN